MNINIVNYESGYGINGILTKYAEKMHETLKRMGVSVTTSSSPDHRADINHHINYLAYRPQPGLNTLMVTHFTGDQGLKDHQKVAILEENLKTSFGVCFSQTILDFLVKEGLDKNKLGIVLPAHDSLKRRPFIIAVLTKAYPDGRKREKMLLELSKVIDKEKFAFRIMGHGWRDIVEEMYANGFNQIEYFEDFGSVVYKHILDSSDYLLYTGAEDEGAISILDAKQAGLRIIAPLSGFHNEIGVEYPFYTQEELNKVFEKLSINPVESWTWEKYCKDHLDIWEKLYATAR